MRTAIADVNAKFVAAVETGDTAAAVARYDADATVLPPGGPAWHGTAAITQGFGGMLGAFTVKDFTLTSGDVVVGGDYATETGSYKMTMVPKKGAAMEDVGKYVVAWKKQADGTWKLYRDIWNTDVRRSRERREKRRCQLTAISGQLSDQGPRYRFAHRPVTRSFVW